MGEETGRCDPYSREEQQQIASPGGRWVLRGLGEVCARTRETLHNKRVTGNSHEEV